MTNVRKGWLDTARGLGIILVVFGHAERGLVMSGILTGSAWTSVDKAIYSFHMPLFMLLAGLNIPHSLRRGTKNFLSSKAYSIAYPYFVWSIIYGCILAYFSHVTNSTFSIMDLTKILWQPITPFWFLYAMMVYCVLWALIANKTLLWAIVVFALVILEFARVSYFTQQLLFELPFFAVGARFGNHITSLHAAPRLAITSLALIIWVALLILQPADAPAPYLSVLSLPVAACGIVLSLMAAFWISGPSANILGFLGRYSMPIFVLHIIATGGTRILMDKMLALLHVARLSGLIYLCACSVSGIVIPLVFYYILRKMSLTSILGLGRQNLETVQEKN